MDVLASTLLFRITRLVVLLALACAAMVAVATIVPLEKRMKSAVGEQEFMLVKAAAGSLDLQLDARRALLRAAADRLQATADVGHDPQSILSGQRSLNAAFSGVFLLDAGGRIIASPDQADAVGVAAWSIDSTRQGLLRDGKGVTAQVSFGAGARQAAQLLVEPVFDAAGQVRYALAGSVAPRDPRIGGQLDTLILGKTGYFLILDPAGTIVHHPDRRRIMSQLRTGPGDTGAAPAGDEGWVQGRTERGDPALLAYKRLRTLPWVVAAVYPLDDAFAAVNQARALAWFTAAMAAILAGAAGLVAAMRLLAPLEDLRCRLGEIEAGVTDIAVLDVARPDEIGALSRAFFTLSQQRCAAEARLARLAFTDPLTGIANRRMLEDALACALARSRRTGYTIAVAYLDIDRFKAINDTMGHAMGDAVLVEFAARLKTAVRSHDTVARLAGDEFMVVMDGLCGAAEAAEAARRIIACIGTPFSHGAQRLFVTTSIGIALQHARCRATSSELIGRADAALYLAKRNGRGRYVIAPEPDARALPGCLPSTPVRA